MEKFFTKNKLKIIFTVLGATGGFFYWRFVGCTSGTCPLISVWYKSTLLGLLIGYLIGDVIVDLRKKRDKMKNE